MIDIQNLTRRYEMPGETLTVLDGVTLQIADGESVAVTGPSGSGKSTFLNLLGALDKPTAGSVSIDATALESLNDRAAAHYRNRTVGFIFQSHYLLPQCNVLENVMTPRLAGDWVEAEKTTRTRAEKLIEEVGLKSRLTHRPHQLSGGEQLRVAVARALINEPKLVLADEPTGSLDQSTTERVAELLSEINTKRGVTLVVVTHNSQLAARMQTTYHLRGGKLEQ